MGDGKSLNGWEGNGHGYGHGVSWEIKEIILHEARSIWELGWDVQ